MMLRSLFAGFTSAGRHLRLALVFWLASLLLAFPTTMAFFLWWSSAFQYLPGADALLSGVDLGVLIDMAEDSQVGIGRPLAAALFATSLVALVVNALLAGGALELLVAARLRREAGAPREPRSFSHRFFRGAGHFFWRSLALLVLTLVSAGIVVAAVSAGLRVALEPFEDSLSITVSWMTLLTPLVVAGLIVVFFCVFVLDYARIDLVRSDRRNAFRAWWRGLTLALRRFWTTLGIWAVIAILLVLVTVACAAARRALVENSTGLILAGFLAQQFGFIAGAWLRVAGLAAEVDVSFRTRPDPVPMPEPVPATAPIGEPPTEPAPVEIEQPAPGERGPSDVG